MPTDILRPHAMTDQSHALQPVEDGVPLTAVQLKARLAVIQQVMREVMQEGVDYGTIPGTDKPTLLKPGAEKLCVTFRLAPDDPFVESVPELSGDIRYRLRVPVKAANGVLVAVGIGECSTGEEKYHWRRPVHENEFKAAAEDQKRQKWTRKGEVWDQVRVNPADVANTVLKMAHKRAYVHAVIMATAAGSIFTQDVEDLPEGVDVGHDTPRQAAAPRQPVAQPQRASAPPAGGEPVISDPQAKRFYAIAKACGWGDDELKGWLKREYGLDSDRDIPRRRYDEIVKAVQDAGGH